MAPISRFKITLIRITMLVILSILLLLITPPGMHLARKFKPGFTYPWLMGVFGALLAWILIIASARPFPEALQLISWESSGLFSSSPTFLFDEISWAFSLSITATALAVLLTGILGMQNADIKSWGGTLLLAGVSLAAVNAGNLLTLIMAWAALDLIQHVILLSLINDSKVRERIVFSFSIKAIGILLLLWVSTSAYTPSAAVNFANLTEASSIFLVIAAWIRLGILPLHLTEGEGPNITWGMKTLIHVVPAAASLMLLVRTAPIGLPVDAAPYLLGLFSFSALIPSAIWAAGTEKRSGQSLWVLGMSSLAAAAATLGQTSAVLAWGVALLLSGGLLFLFSYYHKNLLPVIILALFSISALPFSPTWAGMTIYTPPLMIFHLALFLAQVFLLTGYIRRLFNQTSFQPDLERWGWVIYPLGLAILVISHHLVSIRNLPEIGDISLAGWVGGGAAAGAAALLWTVQNRLPAISGSFQTGLAHFFSVGWIYKFLWRGYRALSELVNRTNRILEGEGGILWAFVLLAIIISLVSQRVLGG